MTRVARVLAIVTLGAAFAVASVWAVLVAAADYWAGEETLEGTRKALALTPGDAEYNVRLGVFLADNDPVKAGEALRRAVNLKPSDARAWIELGLRAEADGQYAAAEQCFFRAADADKKYLPRWTLANYYFRRGDTAGFWRWAKAAAPMIYGDPLPLYGLCGKVAEDGALLDRLDIRKPDLQAAYVSYLLSQNRADLTGPASRKLLAQRRRADVPILLAACDRLIASNTPTLALEIWNGLVRSNGVPGPEQTQDGATFGFANEPLQHAFDWYAPSLAGVGLSTEEEPSGLRLAFSGRQPEVCEPLVRFVPVRGNSKYEFHATYKTEGIPLHSGLTWRITTLAGAPLGETESAGPGEGEQTAHFKTPADCGLARIALVYARVAGTTRIEGSIVLRGASFKRGL